MVVESVPGVASNSPRAIKTNLNCDVLTTQISGQGRYTFATWGQTQPWQARQYGVEDKRLQRSRENILQLQVQPVQIRAEWKPNNPNYVHATAACYCLTEKA